MCEVFNSSILEARSSPILTMLEWIREYIMSRLQKNRDKCEIKWEGGVLCARIRDIVNKRMEACKDCVPIKSNQWKYEVKSFSGSKYAVDLKDFTCDCKIWDLSGIPCKHAISAICSQGCEVEDFVHKCYSVETYASVYENSITPMNGQELWKKTRYIPPLPPNFGKRKKGRPETRRRASAGEEGKKGKGMGKFGQVQKLARQKYNVKCSFCGEKGHNQKGCQWKKLSDEYVDEEAVEMTQDNDGPPMTQEGGTQEDGAQKVSKVVSNRPTTREGRKNMVRKRAEMSGAASSLGKKQGTSGAGSSGAGSSSKKQMTNRPGASSKKIQEDSEMPETVKVSEVPSNNPQRPCGITFHSQNFIGGQLHAGASSSTSLAPCPGMNFNPSTYIGCNVNI